MRRVAAVYDEEAKLMKFRGSMPFLALSAVIVLSYCSRLTRGITSGRLSHADINTASRGQVTPAIIKVLQGR